MDEIGFRADLHCHSICSDGTDTALELIDIALEKGLSALAITDHDNIDSFHQAKAYAKEKGLKLLPGAEISAAHRHCNIHILAYAYDTESSVLKDYCNERSQMRRKRFLRYIALLQKEGFEISDEEVAQRMQETEAKAECSWGRAHLAQWMEEKGFVSSIKQAFDLYIGDKSRCYLKANHPSVPEVIDMIHKAGGLAVWAHPHFTKSNAVVREVLEFDFDGIECFYARIPRDQEEKWCRIASDKAWIPTGGSDYHGTVKPYIFLGASWVGEETFNQLYNHYLGHQKGTES